MSTQVKSPQLPDPGSLQLTDEVKIERVAGGQRIVLWLADGESPDGRHWQRIGSTGQVAELCQGVCAVSVRVQQAIQPNRSVWQRLLAKLTKRDQTGELYLPDGQLVETLGKSQMGFSLVWSDGELRLDQQRLQVVAPRFESARQLGDRLRLLSGVAMTTGEEITFDQVIQETRTLAERQIAEARGAENRHDELTALVDLGSALLRGGGLPQAHDALQQALALSRELDDTAAVADALLQLGIVGEKLGDFRRASAFFEQGVSYSRTVGDPYAEKNALDHLGQCKLLLGDIAGGLENLHAACALAGSLGDALHEAELNWVQAVLYANAHQIPLAIASGQAAVNVLSAAGKPHARWYAEHLEAFRLGRRVDLSIEREEHTNVTEVGNPGFLRMAATATKSMTKFLRSGMKSVDSDTRESRLAVCQQCPQHTGLRCRVCGCFTRLKTSLPHEACPIGKWDPIG